MISFNMRSFVKSKETSAIFAAILRIQTHGVFEVESYGQHNCLSDKRKDLVTKRFTAKDRILWIHSHSLLLI